MEEKLYDFEDFGVVANDSLISIEPNASNAMPPQPPSCTKDNSPSSDYLISKDSQIFPHLDRETEAYRAGNEGR